MKAVFYADGGGYALTITVAHRIMTLRGYLLGDDNTRDCIEEAFRYASHRGQPTADEKLVILASEAPVVHGGEQNWIDVVNREAQGLRLHYTDSQIALLIQRNKAYQHRHTTYAVPV